MVQRPSKLIACPSDHARVETFEPSEEPPVPALRETREVERALMHVLQKRSLRVDEPVTPKDPRDLRDHLPGVQHVFEHGLHPYGIHGPRGERNEVPVSDELDP